MKCLVLDYGGSAVKYGLMDDASNLTCQGDIPAPRESLEQFVEETGKIYDRFKEEIDGIAISFPGAFDSETGTLVFGGAYMNILMGKSILGVLKERCPVPMEIENDGKAAALAEAWKGNLKDCKTGAAIVLGTGIGGGLIQDGKIIRGKNFSAGEFSSIIVGSGGYIEGSATFDCSTTGIVERAAVLKGCKASSSMYMPMMTQTDPGYEERLRSTATGPQYPDMVMNGFELFKLLEAGDPDIERLYKEFIENNIRMIVNVINIYDPDRIVIGGGISKEPRLIADLQEAGKDLLKHCLSVVRSVDIQPCYYRSSANLYGAMYNFLLRQAPELITH